MEALAEAPSRGWAGTTLGRAIARDLSVPRGRCAELYPLATIAVTLYCAAATALMLVQGAAPSVTQLGLVVVVATFWTVRSSRLVWLAAITLAAIFVFFGLDGFAGRAPALTHVTSPISADRWLLGGGGVVAMQRWFLGIPWHALLVPPLVIAYLSLWYGSVGAWLWIWARHGERVARFLTAFLVLECIGELIYLVYPETPPWLASQQGALPPTHRTVVDWLQGFHGLGSWYAASDPAPLAAMPAMHVAVPVLIALTAIAMARRSLPALLWLLYPVSVAAAVLWLGEHYVVDVLVAVTLGAAVFAAVELAWRRAPSLLTRDPV